MENNDGLKGMYLILLILCIASCILSIILGFLSFILSIVTIVITLITKSMLPKDAHNPAGIKVIFWTSVFNIIKTIFMFILFIFSFFIFKSVEFNIIYMIFSFLLPFIVFIAYIIGSILVYKEYDKIN